MEYPKNAIILAAGLGSRLGMDTPKCLIEVNGRKLIDYQLDLLQDFDDIRMVVGFKEEIVMEYVSQKRPDCIFVRNAEYATTTNSCSAKLAAKHLNEPYITLDGDIYISPETFAAFLEECAKNKNNNIICATRVKTEDPVYMHVKDDQVVAFSRDEKSLYEWSGVAYISSIDMKNVNAGYIYKVLEKALPCPSFVLDVYEIDTPHDYNEAVKYVQQSV